MRQNGGKDILKEHSRLMEKIAQQFKESQQQFLELQKASEQQQQQREQLQQQIDQLSSRLDILEEFYNIHKNVLMTTIEHYFWEKMRPNGDNYRFDSTLMTAVRNADAEKLLELTGICQQDWSLMCQLLDCDPQGRRVIVHQEYPDGYLIQQAMDALKKAEDFSAQIEQALQKIIFEAK
ncbi:hypothetical protein MIR68_007477 [Amoeboaphelidium protococcarum]|nr:hypothetical protein MIR68_007477 [Amoeboaphelidium protococcarum]KAI3642004.1 hypothetical protein MP228_011559 [Amoeboaphelidium protococcarum]